jgi:NDP-sugar pyrophosphorylase family protein
MQLVILCGGLATRLRPVTKKIPKSMIMIKDKPFLWHQLELVKKHNINNVILCIGYLGDQIKDYFRDGKEIGMNINYSEEKELLGTAGAIKNAESLLDEEFLIMNGDSYLMFDYMKIINYFKNNDKLALMVIYKNNNNYDTSNVSINNDFIKEYNRKTQSPDMIYIDSGLNIFKKEVLNLIPSNTKIMLDDIFEKLIEQKQLMAYETFQRFYEIGSFNGLKEFERLIEDEK